jgi:cell division protein FtsW (lipid II flippase)
MENNPRIGWKLRAGGVISVLYLLLLGTFEAYSAAATALDRRHALTSWEPHLGWALFVLPIILIASLFLLHGRRSRFGFWLVVMNVCLYAGFLIFESVAYDGQPVSKQAVWEVGGVYLALFLVALLAAHFLKNKTQAIRS